MLGIMLKKLVSKKWMFCCLILGCTLLTATVVSFPLYRNAAFDRMLRDEFSTSYGETGKWPAKFQMATISKKGTGAAELHEMEDFVNGLESSMGVVTRNKIFFYRLNAYSLNTLMERSDSKFGVSARLSSMSDLPEHVRLCGGEMYSEKGITEDNAIEVVMTQECMIQQKLLLGETLEFNSLKDPGDRKIKVKIVGIIDDVQGDPYWGMETDLLKDVLLMEPNLFREYFIDNNADKYNITCVYNYLFEYEELTDEDVNGILRFAEDNSERYPGFSFTSVLTSFLGKRERISTTLTILQVPVLVLLGAFLFMISGQMYELERNEISVIKSRGSSRGQIFRLYIYQSIFLAAVGAVLGVPLGIAFGKILGSASSFLEFGLRRQLEMRFTPAVCIYLAAAMAVTILIMALPAIGHSRVSIVHLKQNKTVGKKAWWEKAFLDVICLVVSLYGYYSYSKNEEQLLRNILLGEPLDPLMYLCSSLFIVGAGLLYLRLQPLLVKLVYLIGQKRWHPASYASFQENLKNGRKQQFIMLFLILTIALGIFHAAVARTILQNAQNNTAYMDGPDIIIKETWKSSLYYDDDSSAEPRYFEPDSGKYSVLDFARSYTKVIAMGTSYGRNTGRAAIQGKNNTNLNLLGIHTREFGEITDVDRSLLEKPYYTYLNELAEVSDGVLLSRNCQTELGLEIGSRMTIEYTNSLAVSYKLSLRVVDFVDYWPGYAPAFTLLNNVGSDIITQSNYLAVVNIDTMQRICKDTQPYEIWMSLEDGTSMDEMGIWINENKLSVAKYVNKAEDLQADVENPLLQGTNGVLTMSFLVMILLCGVGYLIYWIMSIRSREMMFGVLRAFGMHKSELFHMLIIEQFFSGILTICVGIGIGKVASDLFVPILQTAYAVADQVLPLKIYTEASDMVRLYGALAVVMLTCLIVLVVLVVKLNVTKALKLGEE